jgi:hypothetical protein
MNLLTFWPASWRGSGAVAPAGDAGWYESPCAGAPPCDHVRQEKEEEVSGDISRARAAAPRAGAWMSRHGWLFKREFSKQAAQGGWGPVQTWQVSQQNGGPALVFQMRLPQQIDLADIPADVTAGAPPLDWSFGSRQTSGLIVAGALRLTLNGEPSFLGTMAVALSAGSWPPDIDGYLVHGVTDDMRPPKTAPVSDKLSGQGTLLSRLRKIDNPGTPRPVILWTAQFLYPKPDGILAIGFASTNVEVITTDENAVFGKICELCYLGKKPRGW